MTNRTPIRLLALLLLGGCTNSLVETGETWTQPTQAQVAAFRANLPDTVNPYIRERPAPKMGKNGCATSVRKGDNGVLFVDAMHPLETYCISLAPYHTTLLKLPPGVQLVTAVASSPFVESVSANDGEREMLILTSNCVPPRKDEAGNYVPSALYTDGHVDEKTVPTCPGLVSASDLTVVTTSGTARFLASLNTSTHNSQVIMEEQAQPEPKMVPIPARPKHAQDLTVTSEDGEMVPWTPDEAWVTGTRTVIVWHRPMPTLPQFRMGPEGEQTASPRVVNLDMTMAMIFEQRIDFFQLRMDDRILSFSLPTAEVARVNDRPEPWE